MAELIKLCPFCGGEAEVYEGERERNIYDSHTFGYVDTEYYTVYGVGCTACNSIMAEFSSEEEAIEAWNNRATEAEIRAMAITAMSKAMKEFYPSCKGAYRDFDVFFHAVMAKVAEKLKEE